MWSLLGAAVYPGAIANAADLLDIGLVYPRANETYEPTDEFPLVFALQNVKQAEYLEPTISLRVLNLSKSTSDIEVLSDRMHELRWGSVSENEPYLFWSHFKVSGEGQVRVIWQAFWSACEEISSYNKRVRNRTDNFLVDIEVKNGGQKADLVADFIFPALGYFTFVCWAAPNNAVVNQIFGMKSGLGILPVTFDWSQIAYIGSPLVVPTWAILNVLASLIFWIYVVSPAIYYRNTWSSAYLPIQSNSVYDNTGAVYNVSRVIDKKLGFSFNSTKFDEYSELALVYATANVKIQIDIFCRIVAGYVYEGKVLANIWFFNLGYISGIKGLAFAQDLKLGIYCNIPPRKLFLVQAVGIVMGTLGQVSTLNWALEHIPHICTDAAPNGFTCPFSRTHFNTSMVWGALGPRRFFAPGAHYRQLLWMFLLGALLPIALWALKKYLFPRTRWLRKIHVPVFLGGLNYIPPASGTNYGSWAIVGLVFGLWLKRKERDWWRRYNFVLSSALDCSVAIAGVIIFFAVFYTGAANNFEWWGTDVYKDTCDWKGCRYKTIHKGGTFGI
ncbi:hypothetical protein ACHAP6_008810 [Verticillium nonalfalfae]